MDTADEKNLDDVRLGKPCLTEGPTAIERAVGILLRENIAKTIPFNASWKGTCFLSEAVGPSFKPLPIVMR